MPDKEPDRDALFIEIALDRGFLDSEKAEECRSDQIKLEKLGYSRSLMQIALEKGFIDKSKALEIRREMQKRGALPRLGGYELIAKLGQGGMGVVYKARQISLDRIVAIKVLPPELARDQNYVERFKREGLIAARIEHPNAVHVIDVGESGGRHYMVMEYVEGVSTDKLLSNGPLPEKQALEIARGVLEALNVAHQSGIIHRDIKPSNILIDKEGRAKLADLGIARQSGIHGGTLTGTGAAIGTPHYMSPEQCEGGKDLDARADIYSLGATLYHLCCGEQPYADVHPAAVMHYQMKSPTPDPREKNPALSSGASSLIMRMMSKHRDSRPESCVDLMDEMEALRGGKSGRASGSADELKSVSSGLEPTASAKGAESYPVATPRAATVPKIFQRKNLMRVGVPLAAGLFIIFAFVLLAGSREESDPLAQLETEGEGIDESLPAEADSLRDEELQSRYNAKLREAEGLERSERWEEALVAWGELRSISDQMSEKPASSAQIDQRISRASARLRTSEEESPPTDALDEDVSRDTPAPVDTVAPRPAPVYTDWWSVKQQKAIATGGHHTLALAKDGSLWACGSNSMGQLGDGTTTWERHSLIRVGRDNDWEAVAAGQNHSLALKEDGSLWAWGRNSHGTLGVETRVTDQRSPIRVGRDNDWAAVAAGMQHSLALKKDGSLWAWGKNQHGQLGDGTTTDRHSPVLIGNDSDWAVIHAGSLLSLGIKKDGSLWAWGYNDRAQLGDGTTTERHSPVRVGSDADWRAVSAGGSHSVALRKDGSLWVWGSANIGQLGLGEDATDKLSPVRVGNDSDWAAISASSQYTLALKEDGSLWGWGYKSTGVWDGPRIIESCSPIRLGRDTDWAAIEAGSNHALALKKDNSLWAWGGNRVGQLGVGTTTHRLSPFRIGRDTDWGLATAPVDEETSPQDDLPKETAIEEPADDGLAHLPDMDSSGRLNLRDTDVTDADLAHLAGLENLRTLELFRTRVTDEGLAHLAGLENLRSLSLTSTRVTDEGLAHLTGLENLRTLYLHNTDVTDEGLTHLAGLENLSFLEFANTDVTDEGLAHLTGLENLRSLNLGGTDVTDEGLAYLAGLENLRSLNLVRTDVTGEGFAHLSGLKNLRTLYLSNTGVTDEGLAHLAGLENLERLTLDDTGVTDEGLAHLAGLENLEWLWLRDTGVTDEGLAHLTELKNLRTLYLSNTGVTDEGLAHLAGLENLRELSLWGTGVTDEGVQKLKEALPDLRVSK